MKRGALNKFRRCHNDDDNDSGEWSPHSAFITINSVVYSVRSFVRWFAGVFAFRVRPPLNNCMHVYSTFHFSIKPYRSSYDNENRSSYADFQKKIDKTKMRLGQKTRITVCVRLCVGVRVCV